LQNCEKGNLRVEGGLTGDEVSIDEVSRAEHINSLETGKTKKVLVSANGGVCPSSQRTSEKLVVVGFFTHRLGQDNWGANECVDD
jgi:hypothetical protein